MTKRRSVNAAWVGFLIPGALAGCVLATDTSTIDRPDASDVTPDVPVDPCAQGGAPWCVAAGAARVACDAGMPVLELCAYGCVDGECASRCTGETACSEDGGATVECGPDGGVRATAPCPTGYACVGGGCRAADTCVGGSRCDGAGTLELCDPRGVLEVSVDCGGECSRTWPDLDGDGWGDGARDALVQCGAPVDRVASNPYDCDDDRASDDACEGYTLVEPATFVMGTSSDDANPVPADEAQHRVAVSRAFFVAQTEVTQRRWGALSGTARVPALHADCDECPVERVNWFEALRFANRASEAGGYSACYVLSECTGEFGAGCEPGEETCTGYRCDRVELVAECDGFRLPTEGEWELAARAGTTGAFSGTLEDSAWYRDTVAEPRETQPVGGLTANAFGLYDVHGNVAEWTLDLLVPYEEV